MRVNASRLRIDGEKRPCQSDQTSYQTQWPLPGGSLVTVWLSSHGAVTLGLIVQVLGVALGLLLFIVGRLLLSYTLIESLYGAYGGLGAVPASAVRFGRDPLTTTVLVLVGGVVSTIGAAVILCAPPGNCYADMVLLQRWLSEPTKNGEAGSPDLR